MQNALLYLLIFMSGCAGLIYEVVWHRYLAILLGAQARATAIVLAIFLGGIAAGYATFGKWSRYKKWNLLRTYGYVEFGLGVWAALFPLLFRGMVPFTAKLYSWFGLSNLLTDIFVSILLIGFPTFLMGGTLPLLTQGMSEDLQKASRTHARIYGINTLGACIGSMLAGYALIPVLGLHLTAWFGSLLNLAVALIVLIYFVPRTKAVFGSGEKEVKSSARKRFNRYEWGLLAVGFLSGFYLLSLQTILIRLMGLSTGSSNYNFTLIVSIFIFGLGVGSLLVKRINQFEIRHLMWNQIGVAALLFLVYLSGDYWSYWVHLVRITLRDNVENFFLYQAMLGLVFATILVIPIGLAGFTMPLTFHLLKDRADTLGQRVGQLYGVNSLGCVLGAMFGGYLMFEFLNLDQLFKFCVFLVLATVGIAIYLDFSKWKARRIRMGVSAAAVIAVFVGLIVAPLYHRDRFTQPFRQSSPLANVSYEGADAFGKYLGRSTDYLLFKDGPNTSLGVGATIYQGKEMSRTIFVNGKSDGNTRGDYFTTIMLAHLPGLLAKKMENVAVIGFGTGITIGTLSLYEQLKQIDVVEISGTILKNAFQFDAYNGDVSKNAKVKFHEMDAFRFLQGRDKKFDVIVSEPSNPWVSGIENLYSAEFYEMARNKMDEDGLFVQWIHTYSFNDYLFRMVLKTMSTQFSEVSVFALRAGDFALVGRNRSFTKADLARGRDRMNAEPTVLRALVDGGLGRFEAVLGLEVIPAGMIASVAENMPEHHLESPLLSNLAAKAFFVGTSLNVNTFRRGFSAYYSAVPNSLLSIYNDGNPLTADAAQSLRQSYCDHLSSKNVNLCEEILAVSRLVDPNFRFQVTGDTNLSPKDQNSLNGFSFYDSKSGRTFASVSETLAPDRIKFSPTTGLQEVYDMFDVYKRYYSPVAQLPAKMIISKLHSCLASTAYTHELYGECLLQKILVLESVKLPDQKIQDTITAYLDWFGKFDKKNKNYEKLRDAKEILLKMKTVQKG